jgi:polyisoprenoid-binding protein YceI
MATAVQPSTGTYDLDPDHSSIQFAVEHLGVSTFRASFADIHARLAIDGETTLAGSASVESVSITQPDFRRHVVRGDDFFAADEHPSITFRSTDVALERDGRAVVSGELVIRGVSRPVTARGTHRPATLDPSGNVRVGLELSSTVDRRAWGMSWQMPLPDGSDALGWDVRVTVHLELVKAA